MVFLMISHRSVCYQFGLQMLPSFYSLRKLPKKKPPETSLAEENTPIETSALLNSLENPPDETNDLVEDFLQYISTAYSFEDSIPPDFLVKSTILLQKAVFWFQGVKRPLRTVYCNIGSCPIQHLSLPVLRTHIPGDLAKALHIYSFEPLVFPDALNSVMDLLLEQNASPGTQLSNLWIGLLFIMKTRWLNITSIPWKFHRLLQGLVMGALSCLPEIPKKKLITYSLTLRYGVLCEFLRAHRQIWDWEKRETQDVREYEEERNVLRKLGLVFMSDYYDKKHESTLRKIIGLQHGEVNIFFDVCFHGQSLRFRQMIARARNLATIVPEEVNSRHQSMSFEFRTPQGPKNSKRLHPPEIFAFYRVCERLLSEIPDVPSLVIPLLNTKYQLIMNTKIKSGACILNDTNYDIPNIPNLLYGHARLKEFPLLMKAWTAVLFSVPTNRILITRLVPLWHRKQFL